MHFGQFLKTCRKRFEITQKRLVEELYCYDSDRFEGVHTPTISKWERGTVVPKLSRKRAILAYFQERENCALPCWSDEDSEYVEDAIWREGLHNILGRGKELVLNYPDGRMSVEDIKVAQVRDPDPYPDMSVINMDIHLSFDDPFTRISQERFDEWALFPGNFYYVAFYKNRVVGILFGIKLRTEVFEDVLSFRRKRDSLSLGDFASDEKAGSIMPVSFFAINEMIGTALMIRLYAHLIANQSEIEYFGLVSSSKEVEEFARRMNLEAAGKYIEPETGAQVRSFRRSLLKMASSEYFVKLIFGDQ